MLDSEWQFYLSPIVLDLGWVSWYLVNIALWVLSFQSSSFLDPTHVVVLCFFFAFCPYLKGGNKSAVGLPMWSLDGYMLAMPDHKSSYSLTTIINLFIWVGIFSFNLAHLLKWHWFWDRGYPLSIFFEMCFFFLWYFLWCYSHLASTTSLWVGHPFRPFFNAESDRTVDK